MIRVFAFNNYMFILLSAIPIALFIFQILRYVRPLDNQQENLQSRVDYTSKYYYSLRSLIIILSILYLIYGSLILLAHFIFIPTHLIASYNFIKSFTETLLLLTLYQLAVTATPIMRLSFRTLPTRKARTIALLIPPYATSIKTTVVVTFLQKLIYYFYKPLTWVPEADTLSNVILIIGISWVLLQIIRALENIFSLRYSLLDEDLVSRKTYTHIVIIKRVAILLLAVLTTAALLMTFKEVRNLGKGLLISTGILTAVFGVSSKQPLEGLLRGIQLAIAQPIRLNDTVIIEGEVGVISAINLTHVIVTLWDKRQMIVPTNYFLEKPFQNWTHETKDLLGTIFFYVDYQLPIEPIRQKFYEYLQANELGLWNGQTGLLQVTGIKENTVELRMLVSADDPEKLFDLQCEIREKMLYTIQQTYPEALPKLRLEYSNLRNIEVA